MSFQKESVIFTQTYMICQCINTFTTFYDEIEEKREKTNIYVCFSITKQYNIDMNSL